MALEVKIGCWVSCSHLVLLIFILYCWNHLHLLISTLFLWVCTVTSVQLNSEDERFHGDLSISTKKIIIKYRSKYHFSLHSSLQFINFPPRNYLLPKYGEIHHNCDDKKRHLTRHFTGW